MGIDKKRTIMAPAPAAPTTPANVSKAPLAAAKPSVTPAAPPAPARPAQPAATSKPVTVSAETPTAGLSAKPAVAAAPAVAAVTAGATASEKPASEGARNRTALVGLIAKLRDPQAETARDAAITLGGLAADAEVVDALAVAVRNTDGFFHPVVRAAAAAALGRLGDRRAVEALVAGTRDTMAEASEEAIRALGRLADPRARPALEAIVRNADGFFLDHVRKAAQEALAKLG